MKLRIFALTALVFILLGNVAFCFAGQTSNTIFGINNGAYLNHLPFRNGNSATFLNDYTFTTAYQESSTNATYSNFWFIDGFGIWATVNLTLNTWFQSGVLNFTSNSNGTVEFYCPNTPTYMLGGPYNLATGYNGISNVWTLTVQNGVSYAATFTRYWGSFYITEVDSNITALGWVGQAFTVDTLGSGGIFSVYTGTRNAPQTYSGLTSESYNQTTDILTGSYGANGVITLDWTAAPGGNPTPTPTTSGQPTPTPTATPAPTQTGLSFVGGSVNLGSCYANESVNEVLNVTFGSSSLTVDSVVFSSPVGGWMSTQQVFPASYTMGTAQIAYVLSVPADAVSGGYAGSVVVSGIDPFGNTVSGSAPYTLTVLGGSNPLLGGVNPWLIIVLLSLIAVVVAGVLISKFRH